MKQKPIILSLLLLFIMAASCPTIFAQGQDNSNAQMRKKWMKEVRSYKYDFFTKELELTKEQQDAFFPEYEAMERAIFTANKEARDLEAKISAQKEPVSDAEYEAAALVLSKTKQKESEIELEYFEKFGKILSKKQLFLLKRAETRFTQNILNHHRKAAKQQQ